MPKRPSASRDHLVYLLALIAGDAVLVWAALQVAQVLLFRIPPIDLRFVVLNAAHHIPAEAAVLPEMLAMLWLRGAYRRRNLLGGPEEYARVLSGCTYGAIAVLACANLYSGPAMVLRGWLLLFWAASVGFVELGRFTLRRAAYALRMRGWFARRVLLVGANDEGCAVAQQLHEPSRHGIRVLGLLDDYLPIGSRAGVAGSSDFEVIGHPSQVAAVARREAADMVVLVTSAVTWETQRFLLQLAESQRVSFELRLAPTAYDISSVHLRAEPLAHVPLLGLDGARPNRLEGALRWALDASLAVVMGLLLAPAAVCLLARAAARGIRPLLLREEVLGRGCRPVGLRLLHPAVTTNPLLRGAPALLSVVRGDFALVGPRPSVAPGKDAGAARRPPRSGLPPGLAGPWRLTTGKAADAVPDTMTDAWLIRNWSIWQHLFILFQLASRLCRRDRSFARWAASLQAGQRSPSTSGETLVVLTPDAALES